MNRRWVVLALVFAGILISYVDRGNLSIAATAIMRDFRISPGSMGVLLSAFFWTYAAFQIPAGHVVDRFGIRRVYAAAFLAWSLASAGMALSRNSSEILSLRVALGLAEAVGPIASLAFIRKHFSGSEQGLPTSIYIAGQTIGPALGALLGSVLLAGYGWRLMFAVTGLGALLWVPVWLYFAPPDSPDKPKAVSSSAFQPISWPWHSILNSGSFWAMSACAFLFSYYWYFLLTWMPSYLILDRNYSTLGMGQILSAPLFAMALVNIAAGWLADKLIAKTAAVFAVRVWFASAGLVGAGSILLFHLLPGRRPVLPILFVSVCSFGIANSNFWAISQHLPPIAMVGRTIGYLNTVAQVGGAAAPLITGWSLGPEKNFGLAILLAGFSPLLACAILLFLGGPRGLDQLKANLSHQPSPSDQLVLGNLEG